jgi:hypothetical protein
LINVSFFGCFCYAMDSRKRNIIFDSTITIIIIIRYNLTQEFMFQLNWAFGDKIEKLLFNTQNSRYEHKYSINGINPSFWKSNIQSQGRIKVCVCVSLSPNTKWILSKTSNYWVNIQLENRILCKSFEYYCVFFQ